MRPLITANSIGWVYLWHFSRPLGNLANRRAQAQHYVGYADDADGDATELERRAAQHLAGQGAKITRAAIGQGIELTLVMAWRAPLSFEKQIKRRKEAPRLCPICCRAHGRKLKIVTPGVEQLALPLDLDDGDDFPAPPALAMDGYEYLRLRGWSQQRAAAGVITGLDDQAVDIPW